MIVTIIIVTSDCVNTITIASLILIQCITCYITMTATDIVTPGPITRFPLTRFSPGAGLLRCVFFNGSG